MCMDFLKRHGKRILLESLGWLLVVIGVVALILPGPGLLMIFAGMALLATQYEWAERRLEPIRKAALKTAEDSVKSWPRILLSVFFSVGLIALGITWGIHPAEPSWWPFVDNWWLLGGWGTGGTLIASGLIALGIIVYSFFAFRPSKK
jgi:uncharacterized protein (TIGR02611 family)